MRNLLKYDIRSLFRVWWISSLSILGVALMGGGCLQALFRVDSLPPDSPAATLLGISAVLGLIFTYLTLFAYGLLIFISILKRFYSHLFTDEGYLTFTLPVRRSRVLLSKLLTALLYHLLSLTVIFLGFALLLMVGLWNAPVFFLTTLTQEVSLALHELANTLGGFLPVYGAEFALLLIVDSVFGILFAYLCITVGAIVAKRQKILAAVGIYYGGTILLSIVSQVAFSLLFGFGRPLKPLFVNELQGLTAVALLFAAFVFLLALLAVLCYWLILRLLRSRLNLT